MLSTSVLTWAAAQENVPAWELIRALTPADERRIEAAYAEWRRRAAAGERRHKVDWRSFPIPDLPTDGAAGEPMAQPDAAVPVQEAPAEPAPAVVHDAAEEQDAASIVLPEERGVEPEAAAAIEAILTEDQLERQSEEDYVSLDDFNLEPSEEEMKALERVLRDEAAPTPETLADDSVSPSQERPVGDQDGPIAENGDEPAEGDADTPAVESGEAPDRAAVERRISRLPKDASLSDYAELLSSSFGGDIDTARAVTEAVIKDHTKRHRGTAAQRAFLAWLEERG